MLEKWPHLCPGSAQGAGRGWGTRGAVPCPPPRAQERALPPNPPKGATSGQRTRREAGAHRIFPDSFVGGAVGWGARPTVATAAGPETRGSLSRNSPAPALPVSPSAERAVPPRPGEPRLPEGHLLPEPAGPKLTSAPPNAPKLRRTARGLDHRRSPGRSRLRTLLQELGDPTWAAGHPHASLSRTHQAWVREDAP